MTVAHALTCGDQGIGHRQQHPLRQGWLGLAAFLHQAGQFRLAIESALLFMDGFGQQRWVEHQNLLREMPVTRELGPVFLPSHHLGYEVYTM